MLDLIGPIFKLKVPNFKGMNEKYKRKLEELGYPSDQPQPGSMSRYKSSCKMNSRVPEASTEEKEEALMGAQNEEDKQGQNKKAKIAVKKTKRPQDTESPEEGAELLQGKKHAENPWIQEMNLREVQPSKILSPKAGISPEEIKARDASGAKDAEIINREFDLELFMIPNQRETRQITRYDTWQNDLLPEVWIQKCKESKTDSHGLSPVYNGETYVWQPVSVEGYDPETKKYQVVVLSSGQKKGVSRLALLFNDEDKSQFQQRLKECRERRDVVESELRFQDYVDSVPSESVTNISAEMAREVEKKVQIREDGFDHTHAANTISRLMQVVSSIYKRTMKKCVILLNSLQSLTIAHMIDFRIPIKFTVATVPYYGVIDVGREKKKYLSLTRESESYFSAGQSQDLLRVKSMPQLESLKATQKMQDKFNVKMGAAMNKKRDKKRLIADASRLLDWQTGKSAVGLLTDELQKLYEDFKNKKLFQTDLQRLQGIPLRSSKFMQEQEKKIKAITTEILNNWRFQILHDIRQKIKSTVNFDISNMDDYEKSQAKKIIRKFDYIFHNHLGQFYTDSINDLLKFMQMFTVPRENELWKVSNLPLIEITIYYTGCENKAPEVEKIATKKEKKGKRGHDDKKKKIKQEEDRKIYFKPSLEDCREKILSLLKKLIENANKVTVLETPDYNVFLKENKKAAYELTPDMPLIKNAEEKLNKMIDQCVVDPQALLDKFKKYETLMKGHANDISKKMEGDKKPSLDELRTTLDDLTKAGYEVQTLAIDKVPFTMFQVKTDEIKKYLFHRVVKLKTAWLRAIKKYCETSVQEILDRYKAIEQELEEKPTSNDAYKVLKACIKDSDKRIEEQKARHDMVRLHIGILEDNLEKLEKDNYFNFFLINKFPGELRRIRSKGINSLSTYEEQIKADLERKKDLFDKELNKYKIEYNDVIQFNDVESAQKKYKSSSSLQKSIEDAVKTAKDLNDIEDLLEMKRTEYSSLDKLDKDFKPFNLLITLSDEVQRIIDEWLTGGFNTLKPVEVEEKINYWVTELDSLGKQLEEFKEQADVTLLLKNIVSDFKQHTELIKCLRSEAMKEEEWTKLKEATGIELKYGDDNLTLNILINKGTEKHMPVIKEIWEKAEKKLDLEKRFKKMREEMKKRKLEITPYFRDPKMNIIHDFDGIMEAIDEQIMSTQNMLNSPYMTGTLKRNCQQWAASLTTLSEILEELKKCQKTWFYLEPMFASEDVRLTLKREAEQFQEIHNSWKTQMDTITPDPTATLLLDRERVKEDFSNANDKLDAILKSLADFLEAKRKKFPRFYFISDDDLLKIISNAKKDPLSLQPYFNKCFEGINTFEMTNPNQEIIAISSPENEKISLIRPLGIKEGDRKGNAEIWLKDLEKIMIDTLRDLCKKAIKDHPNNTYTKWILNWPGQIILVVNQIVWTNNVENALQDSKIKVMEALEEKLKNQINDVSALARGELDYNNRLTLETLLVLSAHSRDIVRNLIDKKILDISNFDWTSQLRYYSEKEDIKVKMATASLKYGFEYLGNIPRLVITPLTDRCYRTLMTAKQMNRGGALEGPAGTGKTETVKDLAKALGIYCVIFNGSEELDHLAVAKFFKGIASAGAWCCFDEFNRIDLEVLSVIASQILMIQQALTIEQSVFHFIDEDVVLSPQCGINITMNPGNIGRTALPDNLKALFRPCAMTMPDYIQIAEILLYSYGFQEARNLAKKIVAVLRLCTEQLSSQEHYDFGMRALNAILITAQSLKKKMNAEKEEVLARRALDETNMPKLLAQDIPFYEGIAADLFPGITYKSENNTGIRKAIEEALQVDKLQGKDLYIKKCIQIYETTLARHGVIIIGEAFSGKTQAMRTLKKALSSLKEYEGHKYANMVLRSLNPKAIEFKQLYGSYDGNSRIWTDGVLPILIRECTEMESPDKKWIVFDGPVDTAWMESMNTVLDDNKKLCLSSGSVIKLKTNLTMLFEVEELKHASPAIVSRCGMVFMESHKLGWDVLVHAYCDSLPAILTPKRTKTIEDYMMSVLRPTVAFVMKYCKFPIDIKSMHLVRSFLNIFESFIAESRSQTYKPPQDIDASIPNIIVFCMVWSFGGCVEQTYRDKFNEFLLDMMSVKDVKMKYKLELESDYVSPKFSVKFKEGTNVFDLEYYRAKNGWRGWNDNADSVFATYTRETKFHEIIVPSVDSIRIGYLLNLLMNDGKHLLFVGPTGTGKTIGAINELKKNFTNEKSSYITLCMSAHTSANQTQHTIESKMEKRGRKVQYGPLNGKKGVVFIDDLNMPKKDQFEAQPPLELLRQWMDYGGWYDIDTPDKRFKNIEDICFLGAMAPPSAGRQTISTRYLRHFNTIYVEHHDGKTLKSMFKKILDWSLANGSSPYGESIIQLTASLTEVTVELYMQLLKEPELRPTPSKSHYAFNLRDVAKVFQGLCRSSPLAIRREEDMIKLWAHECIRAFHDRLISQQDREVFMKLLKSRMHDQFGREWESMVTMEPLIFGDFVPCIYPDGDKTKDPYTKVYCELSDKALLKTTVEGYLAKFNSEQHKSKLEVVLFMSAIEQISQILRIITLPLGHALLVGVGGSGRKSLTSLATFIGGFNMFKIETTRKYKIPEWHNDLRNLMFATGVECTPTVFFISDTQISNAAFLEDANSLLNYGDVPNLYSKLEKHEGKEDLLTKLKDSFQSYNKKPFNNDDDVLEVLKENSKKNLHIVFSMSPVGEEFRYRLRMFPSIVNCTTINWFLGWPEEALRSVASQYLVDAELAEKEREGILSICVDMQERVRNLTEKYKKEMRFQYYVTPTSYLELLKTFKKLLIEKRKKILEGIKTYETGLGELKKTEAFVIQMKAKLAEMEPEQKKRNESAAHLADSLKKKQLEVQDETKTAQKEQEKAEEAKKVADELKTECQANVDKALPDLEAAEKAVKNISQAAISTLQNLPAPSESLKPIAKALSIVLDIKPKTIPKAEPDYWQPKKVFTQKNLKKLIELDKENIPLAKVTELKKIIELPEFTKEKIEGASPEGAEIAFWLRALVKYDQVNRELAPKKAKLKEESDKANAAHEAWMNTNKQLEEKKTLLQNLKQQSESAEIQKRELQKQIEITKKKSERARDLLDMLKNENKRWNEQWIDLQEKFKNILGDMLVSSGIIAYLGVFPASYRDSCTDSWRDLLSKFEIPKSQAFSLFNILGDPVQKLRWQTVKLPTDAISTDNAIIMEYSSRWPLLIDPQRQAVNWIKVKDKVEIIKRTLKIDAILKRVSQSMTLGGCILFEDIGETIDSRLEPLIKKDIHIEATKKVIRLGEENVVLSPNFKLYLATKLPRPHYSPEICALVTMLNFTATEEGLKDQMLNIIVEKEEHATESSRLEGIQKSFDTKGKLKKAENEILEIVTSRKEEILESDQLLDKLKNATSEYIKSNNQVNELKKSSDKLEVVRSKYQTIAKRVANLYFCVAELAEVEPMYQYSLDWYKDLYKKSLITDPETDPASKLELYKKKFTYMLFNSICKSIFEKDKLLFTLNILLNIFISEETNKPAEVKYLITGWTTVTAQCPPNPAPQGSWLTDKIWTNIWEVSQSFPAFTDFDKEISTNLAAWEKIVSSPDITNQVKLPWPNGWSQEKLNPLQKLILIKIFRQDKFIEAVHSIIAEILGKEYLEYPSLNLEEAFATGNHKVPILFILAPGADPLSELKAFAEKKNLVGGLVPLSLGRGQGKKADFAIDHALKAKDGGWVIMQNCHLALSYLPHLEKKLDEITDDAKVSFKLWLTSMPTNKFPVTLLQNAVKITNEQPKGIMRNMLDTYTKLDAGKFAESNPKPQIWRKLLYGLSMFHAVVQERAKYGSLGWNNPYDFAYSDLQMSVEHLRVFLNEYETVPWEALKYMIAEVNYGGRISDPLDARCIQTILSDIFVPDAIKDNYRFCKRKEYGLPPDLKTKENYINHIKGLPVIDDPEVFGLNEMANTTCCLNDANQLLSTLTSLLSHTAMGSADTQEQEIDAKAKQLFTEMPNSFDLDEIHKKYPYNPAECMNTVLLQELGKYNNLLNVAKRSLNDLQGAIKGYVLMTHELENVADSILKNVVPKIWENSAYPSLKPLSSWVKDLIERIKFFQEWVEKGKPASYWISAFFFTQAFFTGVLQNYARKTHISVDLLTIDYTMLPQDVDKSKAPEEGYLMHGLFIEGAKWSYEKSQLDEADTKALYTPMPYMLVKPIEKKNVLANRKVYECPVYRIVKRQAILTNSSYPAVYMFSIDVPIAADITSKHWIKRGVAMISQLNY